MIVVQIRQPSFPTCCIGEHGHIILESDYHRVTYNTGKRNIASVARRLELGNEVLLMNTISLDTASWLITKGEGMGRQIYR